MEIVDGVSNPSVDALHGLLLLLLIIMCIVALLETGAPQGLLLWIHIKIVKKGLRVLTTGNNIGIPGKLEKTIKT